MQIRDLTDNVCVVTGASSGIGEAAARALSAEGAKVILVARRTERIQAIKGELGASAEAVTLDVCDPEAVNMLFERIKEEYGGLDLLFNNAGNGYYDLFADSKPDEWKKQIDVNLYGVLNCTHNAIPLMRGREAPMIASVASVNGRYGVPGWSIYSATKFAVVGFHDALRKELGEQGIRTSLIEPGAVYTDWGENVSRQEMNDRYERLEALSGADVARYLVFAFGQPAHVNLQEQLIMPTRQIVP